MFELVPFNPKVATLLCCAIQQRTDSPDVPNVRHPCDYSSEYSNESLSDSAERERHDSGATVDVPEDLYEIQEILKRADDVSKEVRMELPRRELSSIDPIDVLPLPVGRNVSADSISLKSRIRKRLSRKSRSSLLGAAKKASRASLKDSEKFHTLVANFSSTLLSDKKASEGGYDSDPRLVAIEDLAVNLSEELGQEAANTPMEAKAESREIEIQDSLKKTLPNHLSVSHFSYVSAYSTDRTDHAPLRLIATYLFLT